MFPLPDLTPLTWASLAISFSSLALTGSSSLSDPYPLTKPFISKDWFWTVSWYFDSAGSPSSSRLPLSFFSFRMQLFFSQVWSVGIRHRILSQLILSISRTTYQQNKTIYAIQSDKQFHCPIRFFHILIRIDVHVHM